MALDDLKTTIETLRERIQAHRPYLEGYETRTRQVLIDPMLDKLGWDVGDPNFVKLEYRVGQGRLDYALMGSEGPIAVIEAKVLGTPLDGNETMQALNYANTAGISYMTLTNGDHWRMLEVFKQAPIEDRILMNFQLTQDEPYACALQALGLWRPNLASSEPQETATPVMIEKSACAESTPTISKLNSENEVAEPSPKDVWMPLTSLNVENRQKVPASVLFPNSSPKSLSTWTDLLVETARHLVEKSKLSAQNCPVCLKDESQPLLLTKTNAQHLRRKRKVADNIWLSTMFSRDNKNVIRNKACELLGRFGVNPSTVRVSTAPFQPRR